MRTIRFDHRQQFRHFVPIGESDRLAADAGGNNRPSIFRIAAAGRFIPDGGTSARLTIAQQSCMIESIQNGCFRKMAVRLDAIHSQSMDGFDFSLHRRLVWKQSIGRPITPGNSRTDKNAAAI